jgi:hypothetical protein
MKNWPAEVFLCRYCDGRACELVVAIAVTLASSKSDDDLEMAATLARCLPGRREVSLS